MKKFILIKEKIISIGQILGIDKIDENISEPVANIKKENSSKRMSKLIAYLTPVPFKFKWIDRVQYEIKVEVGTGNPLWVEGGLEASYDGAVSSYSPGYHVKDSDFINFVYSSKEERDEDFMRIFKELTIESK